MAGSMTVTETMIFPILKVKFAWTSDSSGTGSITYSSTGYYTGELMRFFTAPSTTLTPSSNYSLTLTDADGYDLLGGYGANRSGINTEWLQSGSVTPMGAIVANRLRLNVTKAGNAKKGVAIAFLRRG